MTDSILFYFDFSSSYSYIAYARLAEIERKTGLIVEKRPIVLGAVFQQLGHTVPDSSSVKMQYLTHDLTRIAMSMGIAYQTPPIFPFNGIEAMRIYCALDEQQASQALEFSSRVFDSAYARNIDMSKSVNLAAILSDMGLEYDDIVNAESFDHAKAKLKENTQLAVESKVFGAPTFVYRSELFWGADRIDMLIDKVSEQSKLNN